MDARLEAVPPQIYKTERPRILGMTSAAEQAFLEWYASTIFTGTGTILDLGCWLGSSTIPLARGLAANAQAKARGQIIHAYDLFTWRPTMVVWVRGTKWEGRLKEGDSFLPLFAEITGSYPAIKPYAGDLTRTSWGGGPIEFIHVDAMKSWPLTKAIVQEFFTALLPNSGVIVHQDYVHYYESWIHLVQFRLRDHFKRVHLVPSSSSVVFALTASINRETAARVCGMPDWDDAEIEEAFDWSCAQVAEGHRGHVLSAKAMAFVHHGRAARAREIVAECRAKNIRTDANLDRILAEAPAS